MRERKKERGYGLCEMVEVDGRETEEIVAAEPPNRSHLSCNNPFFFPSPRPTPYCDVARLVVSSNVFHL